MLSVLGFRLEARRNPGLAASCLMSIRYSVRYVLQGRYQGLSLFAAAFDLTWLTCLSSRNGHLPGTLRSPVQITYASALLLAGTPKWVVSRRVGHAHVQTTIDLYGWVREDEALKAAANWKTYTSGWRAGHDG